MTVDNRKEARVTDALAEHPACAMFPLLDGERLQELADDIAENGQRDPIMRLRGTILDGRARLRACQLAGVEPVFTEWDGDESGITAPMIFALQRLTEFQEREPSAFEHVDAVGRGRRCRAEFPLGQDDDEVQVVRGVVIGEFVDTPPDEGGTGQRMVRFLGDDGQVWEAPRQSARIRSAS